VGKEAGVAVLFDISAGWRAVSEGEVRRKREKTQEGNDHLSWQTNLLVK
jgi:hypothetical protein